jgi:membrane associated rhomboid family serine protease
MLRLTPVVKNLVIINVVIFLVDSFMSGLHLMEYLALWNVRTEYFQPYQLFTYMFAHGGFMHIFFNMLALSFMGPILETYWGPKRFLLFYMITGIGAGVFNILVDLFFGAGSFGLMMGASGAVYGVLTAFGVLFPNMEIMLLIPPIPIKAKYLVLILGGIAIYSGFNSSPGDNTAHFAHLGGIVVAFILLQFWRGSSKY